MKRQAFALALLAGVSGEAGAHSFGKLYTLPIPVWMYLYGAAAALLLSFVVVAVFVNAGAAARNQRRRELPGLTRLAQVLRAPLQLLGVILLLLCIASGLFGSDNAYTNFNMTFFWIVFVLGYTYLTALIGDTWVAISPWRTLIEWSEGLAPRAFAGRIAWRQHWGEWPALLLYMAFIALELFGHVTPRGLALSLIAYTAINFAGAWWVGARAWFEHGEFFAVFLRLVGQMGVLEWREDQRGRQLQLRAPFTGLLRQAPGTLGGLLFVLFMLASTAYDGLRETLLWISLYWKHFYQAVGPGVGAEMLRTYPFFEALYQAWQVAALLLAPFMYLAVYLGFIALTRLAAGSTLPLRLLALRFACTLLPIALVYHVTHYYTLLLEQGPRIVSLLSDPFGRGWNLFGTASLFTQPPLFDAVTIWHTQVWLILLGHIVSVYLAHVEALRLFGAGRRATVSQLPMLLLMVALTTLGLWILSLPIASGWVGPQ